MKVFFSFHIFRRAM